jgi:hypothetical protein
VKPKEVSKFLHMTITTRGNAHAASSQPDLSYPSLPLLLWEIGLRRIDDPHHPRGYRELRSNAEMRKLMNRKITAQNGICGICREKFTDYSDIVPDHISPRGMGGAWRDDHPDNIQAVHWWCNGEKGSSRG